MGSRSDAAIAATLLALLLTACSSAPKAVQMTWVPPPRSASCSEGVPCENVKRWFEIEKQAAEARPACRPVPLKGSEEQCARAEAAYAKAHAEQIDYFGGLCAGSVGVAAGTVIAYLGLPESDRVVTCGGKPGVPTFTCRLWEWTWATASRGGAFVVFLVQPEGAPAGSWVLNACSYCESGGACREFPFRP